MMARSHSDLTIRARLPSINEYVDECRKNQYTGARMKRDAQEVVEFFIRQQLGGVHYSHPVKLVYHYYEPNKKRDLDNISGFAHKVIQDALVSMGVLENDGWKNITGFSDEFSVDKSRPRIEVTIIEEVR